MENKDDQEQSKSFFVHKNFNSLSGRAWHTNCELATEAVANKLISSAKNDAPISFTQTYDLLGVLRNFMMEKLQGNINIDFGAWRQDTLYTLLGDTSGNPYGHASDTFLKKHKGFLDNSKTSKYEVKKTINGKKLLLTSVTPAHSYLAKIKINHSSKRVSQILVNKEITPLFQTIMSQNYTSLPALKQDVGRLTWLLSMAVPFARGSAACNQILTAAIYKTKGYSALSYNNAENPQDLDAIFTPKEDEYVAHYKDIVEVGKKSHTLTDEQTKKYKTFSDVVETHSFFYALSEAKNSYQLNKIVENYNKPSSVIASGVAMTKKAKDILSHLARRGILLDNTSVTKIEKAFEFYENIASLLKALSLPLGDCTKHHDLLDLLASSSSHGGKDFSNIYKNVLDQTVRDNLEEEINSRITAIEKRRIITHPETQKQKRALLEVLCNEYANKPDISLRQLQETLKKMLILNGQFEKGKSWPLLQVTKKNKKSVYEYKETIYTDLKKVVLNSSSKTINFPYTRNNTHKLLSKALQKVNERLPKKALSKANDSHIGSSSANKENLEKDIHSQRQPPKKRADKLSNNPQESDALQNVKNKPSTYNR